MIFVNEFGKLESRSKAAIETFCVLLSPLAPHIAEELWQILGHDDTVAHAAWPVWDEDALKVDAVEILVQELGKPKARIMMPPDANPEQLEALALADDSVQQAIAGKTVAKVIAVPGRLVNIIAK
jgi:leucyl-tRNA synthetase